jgi:hypothetical protein
MNEVEQPEWLKGFVPAPQKGNPAWVKGGRSPNPRGRPPGIVDKRTRMTQALADEAPEITRVVIEAAKAGDLQAATLVLSRVCPPLKANAERVQFELDPNLPLAEQAKQILVAVADGKVDPETGKTLIACLSSVANIEAVADLEGRIILLEARSISA